MVYPKPQPGGGQAQSIAFITNIQTDKAFREDSQSSIHGLGYITDI